MGGWHGTFNLVARLYTDASCSVEMRYDWSLQTVDFVPMVIGEKKLSAERAANVRVLRLTHALFVVDNHPAPSHAGIIVCV